MQYDSNVGRWKQDHPGFVLQAGFEGVGYVAQLRDEAGRGVGKRWQALSWTS
jgi:hypothetical protein